MKSGLSKSSYSPPWILFNRHLETIYPAVIRRVALQKTRRERIETPDGDFLDIDRFEQGSPRCVIISHGLEGNSQRAYVVGMASAFFREGYDAMAWNYRGCSGEVNRQLRFYHSGATDDLEVVVKHAARQYEEIVLVGFSLGGNITLKYLGEGGVDPLVRGAVAFSVPVNLHSSCVQISRPANRIYARRFLRMLKAKVLSKAAGRNDLAIEGIHNLKTLLDFDDRFTGPLHGFGGAIDYYTKCSSLYFLQHIRTPTLLVNARNDPFLGMDCFPSASVNPFAALQTDYPERGGHVGFTLFNANGLYWSEIRALSFIKSI